MLVPVSSLSAGAQIMGRLFPMTYFVPISVGTFTKGLGFADLAGDLVALCLFVPALIVDQPVAAAQAGALERTP